VAKAAAGSPGSSPFPLRQFLESAYYSAFVNGTGTGPRQWKVLAPDGGDR